VPFRGTAPVYEPLASRRPFEGAQGFPERGAHEEHAPQESGPDIGVQTTAPVSVPSKKRRKMGYKRIDVRVNDSTLSAIKKRAGSEGKSASEIARIESRGRNKELTQGWRRTILEFLFQ